MELSLVVDGVWGSFFNFLIFFYLLQLITRRKFTWNEYLGGKVGM